MPTAAMTHFDELCDTFPLRPIHTDKSHKKALEMLVSLASDDDRDAVEYKTVLGKLVVDYEKNAGHRLDTSNVSAADVVRHLLEERGMSVSAFARELGVSQGTLNDTLLGKRAWSKTMILKVSGFFGLSTDLFLRA